MKSDIELLSPAGDYKSVLAAIEAKADAIYIGGIKYNARINANNFTDDEIISVIRIAHINNIKVYITLNISIKENEFNLELYNFIKKLYINKADALIVCDIGLVLFIREYFPDFKIHISTQTLITSIEDINFLKKLKVDRVVLARELSLEEINEISESTDIELECFIHGSMCYSYSGRCLLSSFLGERSANRGLCAGPCRLKYTFEKNNKYYLSMKDMCSTTDVNLLIDAKVKSLKIEGRMKDCSYVYNTVRAYKKIIDNITDKRKITMDSDFAIYNRGNGFSNYLFKTNGKEMISLNNASYEKNSITQCDFSNIKTSYDINGYIKLYKNKQSKLNLRFKDKDITVYGEDVKEAITANITRKMVEERLKRTGEYPFVIKKLEIDMDNNIFISNGGLNRLKRKALDLLEKEIFIKNEKKIKDYKIPEQESVTKNNKSNYYALVSNINQFEKILRMKIFKRIYVELDVYLLHKKKIDSYNNYEIFIAVPYILKQKNLELFRLNLKRIGENIKGFLVRTNSQAQIISNYFENIEIVLDYTMNIWNNYAASYYKKVIKNCKFTSPLELTRKEKKSIYFIDEEIVYGYIPAMISQNCILKTNNKCKNKNQKVFLVDRKNKKLTVSTNCAMCYNLIYNTYPINFSIKQKCLSKDINYRFNFTFENEDEIESIVNDFIKGRVCNEYTNFHLEKGVL